MAAHWARSGSVRSSAEWLRDHRTNSLDKTYFEEFGISALKISMIGRAGWLAATAVTSQRRSNFAILIKVSRNNSSISTLVTGPVYASLVRRIRLLPSV